MSDHQPWRVGRCTYCDLLDHVIRTHKNNTLCLECFDSCSEQPHRTVVPKIEHEHYQWRAYNGGTT